MENEEKDIQLRKECINKVINVLGYPRIDSTRCSIPLTESEYDNIINKADKLFNYIKNGK